MRDADLMGDLRYGQRVITGDDLDLNALLLKVCKCLRCILTDTVLQRNEKHRCDAAAFFYFREYKYTESVLRLGLDHGTCLVVVFLTEKDIRCTETVGHVLHLDFGILQLRSKRSDVRILIDLTLAEIIDQSVHGDVAVIDSCDVAGNDLFLLLDLRIDCFRLGLNLRFLHA